MKSNLSHIAFLLVIIGSSLSATASDLPPLPYYDHGACPFECCTYRAWTATADTPLQKDYAASSPVVSVVKAGEEVQGVTGVVVTTKAGIVRITKEISLARENSEQEVKLKPGDVIYNLRYIGEGYDKFWYKGIFLVDQTTITKIGKDKYWDVIDLPEWIWWAKIKRPNGEVGWTDKLDHFAHIDACE